MLFREGIKYTVFVFLDPLFFLDPAEVQNRTSPVTLVTLDMMLFEVNKIDKTTNLYLQLFIIFFTF